MIKVGTKVKFDAFCEFSSQGNIRAHLYTTGTVVFVNAKHKWFSVSYGDPKMRTSFKFCDIGKVVRICG